jgi:hypothetical protein
MTNIFWSGNKKMTNIFWSQEDRQYIRLNKKIETKLDKNKDIDLNWHNISSVKFPINNWDVVNMLYIKEFTQLNTVGIPKLIDIGKILLQLLQQDKTMEIYKDNFFEILKICENLVDDYMAIFEKKDPVKIFEELQTHCSIFQDLKIHIINLILNLPDKMFVDFKTNVNNLLVKSDDLKKVVYRFKTFILQKDKMIDHHQRDIMLIQKNLLILDLGFIYLDENILRMLYIG